MRVYCFVLCCALSFACSQGTRDKLKVKTLSGEPVVDIHVDGAGGVRKLELPGGRVLHGRPAKDSGKIKYDDVAEIKASEDGFKLRRPDGSLLWKVKLHDDKVKISDNEEGTRPFVLKLRDGDHIKVMLEETLLGKVRCQKDGDKVKLEDAQGADLYKSHVPRCTAAIGVLLIKEIAEPERSILIAELWARGK